MNLELIKRKKHRQSFTLLEVLISIALLAVISLAIYTVNVTTFTLFLRAKDKVVLAYELQYAMQHMYDRIMMGKENIGLFPSDPSSSITFSHDDKFLRSPIVRPCTYTISSADIIFNNPPQENNVSLSEGRIDFTDDSNFSKGASNLVRIKLVAEYPVARAGKKETMTLEGGCYPRNTSFIPLP
ncbi:MAG: prepilin-type N-terminal cleavage/methylation domain-containing protein [Candidatus Omnitrophota bacterium]